MFRSPLATSVGWPEGFGVQLAEVVLLLELEVFELALALPHTWLFTQASTAWLQLPSVLQMSVVQLSPSSQLAALEQAVLTTWPLSTTAAPAAPDDDTICRANNTERGSPAYITCRRERDAARSKSEARADRAQRNLGEQMLNNPVRP